MIALLLACMISAAVEPEKPIADKDSFSLTASAGGSSGNGNWQFKLDSAGKAELYIIRTLNKPIRRQFQISKDEMAKLRKALNDERFFTLADEYGQRVPDSSTTTLTVKVGDKTKTVRTLFLHNESQRSKLPEASRVLRLNVLVRGLFNDPEAFDLRPYHQKLIDTAKAMASEKSSMPPD